MSDTVETIKVAMADYKIAKSPNKLITLGLGSCIGIIIYDTSTKIAGMAHIMLPSSKEIKNNDNKFKFADTCIELMYDDLIKNKVNKSKLRAKMAGGAQMFSVSLNKDNLNIGKRNALAVEEILKNLKIPLLSKDVYGTSGRTITFDTETSDLHIRSIGKGEKII